MARFEIDPADVDSNVRRAWDTATGRAVILERGLRSERTRKVQAMPPSAAIAPYDRVRLGNRHHLIHPAPLVLAQPVDEFDLAQAIGSMLDGLAWLHAHGVTHGAIGHTALTSGPTGGRLSLAGALSQRAHAATEDDVYATSALAFALLVGEAPGPEATTDPRLAEAASLPVAAAIRAGLDPDVSKRPSAASLATMVRGEFLLPIHALPARSRAVVRVREVLASAADAIERWAAALAQTLRPYATKVTAGIGAAFAMVLVVAGLAVADQRDMGTVAEPDLSPEQADVPEVAAHAESIPMYSTTVTAQSAPEETIAARETANREDVAVLSAAAAPVEAPAPSTTAAPPPTVAATRPPTTTAAPAPAPTTTVAPKPVEVTSTTTTVPTTTPVTTTTKAPTTTRVTTTTKAPTTTRVTTTTRRTTTTTRATTTTRSSSGKGGSDNDRR